jgi:hypothetical protein
VTDFIWLAYALGLTTIGLIYVRLLGSEEQQK